MSGRAIILIVVGIIIISTTILFRIEAASTKIVANSTGYYKRQLARNIAQSGVNLGLRQLGSNRSYRTTGWSVGMFGGTCTITVFDTTFAGIDSIVGIRGTGLASDSTAVSCAFGYFPPNIVPSTMKGLLTLHAPNTINGGIIIDGRDHDTLGNLIPGNGTWGIWTTGSSFSISGSAMVGGTVSGVDYAPSALMPNPAILLNASYSPSAYPSTPDSVFGGASKGFAEGTLRALAKSGVGGSQYATDPTQLRFPLSGITYVETPLASPIWSPATIPGSGILIVHNSAMTAQLANSLGQFAGIIIADDVVRIHGTVIGAIVSLTTTPAGNVLGNGTAYLLYSRKAIGNAFGVLSNGTALKVIAWWE